MDRDFPESVEIFYNEEFKQKLAISFLNSSILTKERESRGMEGRTDCFGKKAMVDLCKVSLALYIKSTRTRSVELNYLVSLQNPNVSV